MFRPTKQVFIVLMSFNESLTCDWCLFLNDEPSLVRPTLIDLNPAELTYYSFMISLHKCTGSCNVFLNMCSKRNERHKC